MDQFWSVISTFGGWVAAIIVGLIAAFVPKKGSLENVRIDQYQEDRKEMSERMDAQVARIERLEKLLIWYQRRDVAWERREAQIIIGVERGQMPPWPDRQGILLEEHP